jgi:hypothetical protein
MRVLPELSVLCVVDSRKLLCPVRLIVEPLPGYGDLCLYAAAYFAAIKGGVFVVPRWMSKMHSCMAL